MAPVLKLARPAVRAAKNVVGIRSYGGGEVGYTAPKFSELPTPQGSWSEAYSKKSAKGNMILLVGLLSFGTACAHAWSLKDPVFQKADFPFKDV